MRRLSSVSSSDCLHSGAAIAREIADVTIRADSLDVESSRDVALADLQRGQSLAELRKEYPKIFEKYDIETIKLADILSSLP